MVKKDFVNIVHQNLKNKGFQYFKKSQSESILDTVFESVVQVLMSGDDIRIKNFGTFKTKTIKAHDGVHPVTRDIIRCPEKSVPFLKFSSKVKDSISFANK